MARIRTIKPEFWTDEKIVTLSFPARLLFVGLWNFCDDEGFMWDEPLRIKLQILPNDDINVDALLDELIDSGLVARHRTEDDRAALQIVNFDLHQKVSHPSPSRISPLISGAFQSPLEDSGVLPPERNLTELNGKESNNAAPEDSGASLSSSCEVCGDKGWECPRCTARKDRSRADARLSEGLDDVQGTLAKRGFDSDAIRYGLQAVREARASGKAIVRPVSYAVGAINRREAS